VTSGRSSGFTSAPQRVILSRSRSRVGLGDGRWGRQSGAPLPTSTRTFPKAPGVASAIGAETGGMPRATGDWPAHAAPRIVTGPAARRCPATGLAITDLGLMAVTGSIAAGSTAVPGATACTGGDRSLHEEAILFFFEHADVSDPFDPACSSSNVR